MTPPKLKARYFIYAALAFVFVFLFPFPSGGNKFLWKHVFDAGHFALFFALSVGTYFWFRQFRDFPSAVSRSLFLSIFVAAAIEIIQPLTGRSGSWVDLLNGSLGALSASYSIVLLERLGIKRALPPTLLLAALLQLLVLTPTYHAWVALEVRDQHFPQLGYFQTPSSLAVWRSMNSKNNPTPATRVLAPRPGSSKAPLLWVRTFSNTWSGVYYDGGAQDWSNYDSLLIRSYNPQDESLELSLRIDDTGNCSKYADRFNRTFQIEPGENSIRISLEEIKNGPEARTLNLEEIRFLYIFRDKKAASSQFALEDIRLEQLKK